MGLFNKQVEASVAEPIVMYDSTNPDAIPAEAKLVASYVDGYGGYDVAVKRFGASRTVSISVANNDADVADVEPGAMSADQLPGWVARQKRRGVRKPVVYSDRYDHAACYDAVGEAVAYWIADPVGYPITLPGAAAVQYIFTSSWDASWVLPDFPFYPENPKPKPPAPHIPPLVERTVPEGNTQTFNELAHEHDREPVGLLKQLLARTSEKQAAGWADYLLKYGADKAMVPGLKYWVRA